MQAQLGRVGKGVQNMLRKKRFSRCACSRTTGVRSVGGPWSCQRCTSSAATPSTRAAWARTSASARCARPSSAPSWTSGAPCGQALLSRSMLALSHGLSHGFSHILHAMHVVICGFCRPGLSARELRCFRGISFSVTVKEWHSILLAGCKLCKTRIDADKGVECGVCSTQDKFFTQLRNSADGFNVIADFFGRGILNNPAAATH